MDFPRPAHLPRPRQRHLVVRPAPRMSGRPTALDASAQGSVSHATACVETYTPLTHRDPRDMFQEGLGVTENDGKVTVSQKSVGRVKRPGEGGQL